MENVEILAKKTNNIKKKYTFFLLFDDDCGKNIMNEKFFLQGGTLYMSPNKYIFTKMPTSCDGPKVTRHELFVLIRLFY